MVTLSDPARSEAVLVGVHDYANMENLPAVERNLEGLQAVLTDPAVWGLPAAACTVIPQPGNAGQVLDAVRDRARRAQDTLLVYYAGHGLTDLHTDELYLALPDSDPEREYTSLRYEYLRRAVLDPLARAQRTVVILDCCYSGRALLGRMSASVHVADQAAVDGTCLLTASAETRPALSPPGERYTAFTGELITTLHEGVADRPDPLDMDTLYRHLHQKLASKSRPLPQQRNRNTGGLISIARNRAVAFATPPSAPPHPPDQESFAARQSEAEERLAEMERRAEQLRRENEELRQEAERRARQTVETARRLATAIATAPDAGVAPFWFAVPEPRELLSEAGSLTPVEEVTPGTWYLAFERRGDALVVQTQGGGRGLLLDAGGIQHGDDAVDAKSAKGARGAASRRRASETAKSRIRQTLRSAEQLAGAVAAAPEPGFAPFWFAVPVSRPIVSEDGSLRSVAELAPGSWYLAVERRGDALLAQTQDGRRGLLLDASGIQRGDDVVEAPAGAPPPDPDFQPFWFAVPVSRPILSEDGWLNPVAELAPGSWYLAIEQRGSKIVAQTQDGRRGLLLDVSGIQRG